jgi:hypothetical protein
VTGHSHAHDHPHGPLESITHVHGGAPALDIGGDIGAHNVVLDDGAAGDELYLRSDDPAFSIHTGVWTRHLGGGHVTTALFCQLVEGTYWVLDADGNDVRAVEVTGGRLAELDLRSTAAARAGR